tara:strand:- start:9087 stop:9278 length:192 start_codon:yes stop_codon:yes gene_type:complete
MKYNHAISLGFEFATNESDPINVKNLPALVEAAKRQLEEALEYGYLELFDVYDTEEDEEALNE